MWRTWKSSWQDTSYTSYRGLAVAIVISFLLHLYLFGQFGFDLADIDQEPHYIEAQLVTAEAPAPVTQNEQAKESSLIEPPPLQKPPVVEPEVQPDAQPEVTPILAEPTEEEAPELSASNGTSVQVGSMQPRAPVQLEESPLENPVEDSGLAVNPHAYQYVETEFDVRTDIAAKVNSSPAGRAKIVYQLSPNGEQYHLESLMQAKGFAALVIPDLLQISDGDLSVTGLQPTKYLYKFGDKKDKTYSATLDWESKKLTLQSAKGVKELPLLEGTQDLLSFMYQFMFMPPLQNMQLSITNGKKLGTYDYSFAGEEITTTKMGDLRTMHILRTTEDADEKTELWLALDYQYVPVKIRKTEKEDKVYELLATSLKTDKPATESE
jgi:hypothetical protein